MKRLPFFLGALTLFWAVLPGRAVEYTGKSFRDPFSDKNAAVVTAPGLSSAQASQISAIDLQGIVLSPGKSPRAIIDGAIVTLGSNLKAGRVKNITKDGVTISYNDQDYFLSEKGRTLYEKAHAINVQTKQS